MKSSLFFGIIVMIFVPGQALKCYQSEWSDESFNTSTAIITYCASDQDACSLIVGHFYDGSVHASRACTKSLSIQIPQTKVVQPKATYKKAKSMYYIWCETDLCNGERDSGNQTSSSNSSDHAGSISPNFIVLFFTTCTLFVIIKNFY